MNKHAKRTAFAAGICLSLIGISTPQALAAPAELYASQQAKKVSGVIIDATGLPVIGANVLEKAPQMVSSLTWTATSPST